MNEKGWVFFSSGLIALGCSVVSGALGNENGDEATEGAAKGVGIAGAGAGKDGCEKPKGFLDVADESFGMSSDLKRVDGAVVATAVGSVTVIAAGAFWKAGKAEDAAEPLGGKEESPSKGFLAVEGAGGELIGLKSVDAAGAKGGLLDLNGGEPAGVDTAGASAFWVTPDGFANENEDVGVK